MCSFISCLIYFFAEEEVLFEDSPSEAVLNPIGTVEVQVAIVQDEMERQTPQLFSPEVTIISNIYLSKSGKSITCGFVYFFADSSLQRV